MSATASSSGHSQGSDGGTTQQLYLNTPADPHSDPTIFKAKKFSKPEKLALYRKIVGITGFDVAEFASYTGDEVVEPSASQPPEKDADYFVKLVYASKPKPIVGIRRRFWKWLSHKPSMIKNSCYHDVLHTQWWTTWYYYISITFVYTGLLSQVVFGAAITAMSASSTKHNTAVAVLGAFISVLAAILAWMKGVGIPHRTLQYRYALGRVRYYAELMDREFQCAHMAEELDPIQEGWAVVKMYWAINEDYQNNQPDVYTGTAEALHTGKVLVATKTTVTDRLANNETSTAGARSPPDAPDLTNRSSAKPHVEEQPGSVGTAAKNDFTIEQVKTSSYMSSPTRF